MKKTFKKLFAALLAAALVLAMAVPAFAETNAPKGSITIDGTVSGETYTIYRMFKLDSYNAESKTYSYTVESAWEFLQDGCRQGLHRPDQRPPHLECRKEPGF